MNPNDPNIALLEQVVAALGPLADLVVFVGGCAAGLLITDLAQPSIRATTDVDAVVEATAYPEFIAIEERFAGQGLMRDASPGAPLCRWLVDGVPFDLMPMSGGPLGFSNRWYQHAVRLAHQVQLPSGASIRLITAPVFIATKLEAFCNRGGGDYFASHDLEDIVAIVDGRDELVEELRMSEPDLRGFVTGRFRDLLANERFLDSLAGHLAPDGASQARLPILRARFAMLAGLE